MQSKLTLRLDAKLIERAKIHARNQDKSVSQMVADYFALLGREEQRDTLPPLTRLLHGALRDTTADKDEYHKYLEEKYL